MLMRAATAILTILLAFPACSRCGSPTATTDAAGALEAGEEAGDPAADAEPPRLPKHDWNGLSVMMREAEAREALETVGFKLVPSRLDSFPILDMSEHTLTLVPIQGFTPPIVAMETEKSTSPLNSVYGIHLYFHRNRLYSFQPIYYADPVDLVEPGDEAVPPATMEKRLLSTFGEPAWSTTGTVLGPRTGETSPQQMIAWADSDLVVMYLYAGTDDPPTYGLHFISPRGNKLAGDLVARLLKKKSTKEKK